MNLFHKTLQFLGLSTDKTTPGNRSSRGISGGGNRQHRTRKVFLEGLEDRSLMAVDLTAGLMGHWRFDEAAGTTAADVMNQNPGALKNGALASLGQVENGVQLDGVNDYVALGAAATLPTTGTASFTAWIQPTATTGLRNIISHGYTTSPAKGEVFLRINAGKYQVGSWNGSDHLASASIPAGDLNTWVHLAGTYDGSTWRLFRNGQQLATKTDSVGAVPVAADWAIGARGNGAERFFAGKLDEVRVYDRPLNGDEITALSVEIGHSPQMEDSLATVNFSTGLTTGQVVHQFAGVDPDGDILTFAFVSGNENEGLTINIAGEVIVANPSAFNFATHGPYEYLVRVSDPTNRTGIARFALAHSSGFQITGESTASQNEDYVVTLTGGVSFVPWTIQWGDGTSSTVPGNQTSATHRYQSPVPQQVSASVPSAQGAVAAVAQAAPIVTQLPGVNLVVNGSFEQHEVTHSSGWDVFDGIPGWDLDWANAPGVKFELQEAILGGAFEGDQHIELDADENGHMQPTPLNEHGSMGIAQWVDVSPGEAYEFSFAFKQRPGTAKLDNRLSARILDADFDTYLVSEVLDVDQAPNNYVIQGTVNGWTRYTTRVQPQGARLRIQLGDQGTDNTLGTLVDDVQLQRVASDRKTNYTLVEGQRVKLRVVPEGANASIVAGQTELQRIGLTFDATTGKLEGRVNFDAVADICTNNGAPNRCDSASITVNLNFQVVNGSNTTNINVKLTIYNVEAILHGETVGFGRRGRDERTVSLTLPEPSIEFLNLIRGEALEATYQAVFEGPGFVSNGQWPIEASDVRFQSAWNAVPPLPSTTFEGARLFSTEYVTGHVELLFDRDLNGSFATSPLARTERIGAIGINYASEGIILAARSELAASPLNEELFPVKKDERFEIGGRYEFVLEGSPLLPFNREFRVDALKNGVPQGLPHTTTAYPPIFPHTFGAGDAGNWEIVFTDTLGTPDVADDVETKSPIFVVNPLKTNLFRVGFSTEAGAAGANVAGVNADLATTSMLLRRKDTANDWRASVEYVSAGSTIDTSYLDPMPQGALPGNDSIATANSHRLVYLTSITTQSSREAFGITGSNSFIAFKKARKATIAHEFGHQFGLNHLGHSAKQIMNQPRTTGASDDRSELSFDDMKAFEAGK